MGTANGRTPATRRHASAGAGGRGLPHRGRRTRRDDLEGDDVAGEAEGVLAAQHCEAEEQRGEGAIAEPSPRGARARRAAAGPAAQRPAPAEVRVERRDAEGERDQHLPVGEPGQREGVARREREHGGGDAGRAPREEAAEERARGDHDGGPPRERVEVQEQRPEPTAGERAERAVLRPDERAREGAEEVDGEPGIRPPGEHAALDEDGPVGVADEVVEIEGPAGGGVSARDHRRVEVVVEEVGRAQRRREDDRAGEEEEAEERATVSQEFSATGSRRLRGTWGATCLGIALRHGSRATGLRRVTRRMSKVVLV